MTTSAHIKRALHPCLEVAEDQNDHLCLCSEGLECSDPYWAPDSKLANDEDLAWNLVHDVSMETRRTKAQLLTMAYEVAWAFESPSKECPAHGSMPKRVHIDTLPLPLSCESKLWWWGGATSKRKCASKCFRISSYFLHCLLYSWQQS